MSYKSAIISLCSLAVFALIPPLAWHSHTRNIPAIILIVWLLIMNGTCIVNAAIWSDVDFMNRWEGKGWCDIVIKLQVGANIGISCAVTNITYNLHKILKADSVILDYNSWTKTAIDLSISLLTPFMVMGFSYLLQVFRYGIVRYNGCSNLLSPTWITTLLYTVWMLIWSFIGAVYACLVLYVYYKKRKDVRDILHCTNSGLNLTRFARLLIFCFLIILVMFPFSIFSFVQDLEQVSGNYNFKNSHSETFWNLIVKFDTGKPVYNIWLYVLMSYLVFFIFGLGADALSMYSRFLRSIKLGFILDAYPGFVERNKKNKIGKLLSKLSDNTEYQNELYSDNSDLEKKGGFSPTRTSPDETSEIFVDYRIPQGSEENRKRDRFNKTYPYDIDDNMTIETDLELGNNKYTPYITNEYDFDDDISLDGFSKISAINNNSSNNASTPANSYLATNEKLMKNSPSTSTDMDKSTIHKSPFSETDASASSGEDELSYHYHFEHK